MEPIRFRVYSDYLCPWCYLGSHRLRGLAQDWDGAVELEWRAYLLRPSPAPRTPERLEKFRAYTRGWQRVAAEPDAPRYRPWQGDAGPPTHSVPAQVAAKAARRLDPEAGERLHDALLRAYFEESRDISHRDVLRTLWEEAGLAPAGFEATREQALVDAVLDDHHAALEAGVTGVPAVQLEGNPAVIVGAHPVALYQRWVERLRARAAGEEAGAG